MAMVGINQHRLWARVAYQDRIVFGTVAGDVLSVHSGEMFDAPTPTGERVPLGESLWLTPCQPAKMLALWNNYHQAAVKNGWAVPTEPLYFAKTPNAFNAHLAPIPAPRSYEGRVAYEGELGIVIGQACADVSREAAASHIFGYTCVNDVTALEVIARDAAFAQWTRAKNFDGFGVFGPVIASGIDPHDLIIRTLVNGRERQNYAAADMIFDPAQLVSLISRDITLQAGDIIACGTSLGVLPMRPGTKVEIAIDGIGVLTNIYG